MYKTVNRLDMCQSLECAQPGQPMTARRNNYGPGATCRVRIWIESGDYMITD